MALSTEVEKAEFVNSYKSGVRKETLSDFAYALQIKKNVISFSKLQDEAACELGVSILNTLDSVQFKGVGFKVVCNLVDGYLNTADEYFAKQIAESLMTSVGIWPTAGSRFINDAIDENKIGDAVMGGLAPILEEY